MSHTATSDDSSASTFSRIEAHESHVRDEKSTTSHGDSGWGKSAPVELARHRVGVTDRSGRGLPSPLEHDRDHDRDDEEHRTDADPQDHRADGSNRIPTGSDEPAARPGVTPS